VNKSPNKALIAECNRLWQAIARLGTSWISGERAQVGHHMIPRGNRFYMHDLRNMVPLTDFEHHKELIAPHRSPKLFLCWLKGEYPARYQWRKDHLNEYHKAPDREALLATRERLRAFLAAGKPYRWTKEM